MRSWSSRDSSRDWMRRFRSISSLILLLYCNTVGWLCNKCLGVCRVFRHSHARCYHVEIIIENKFSLCYLTSPTNRADNSLVTCDYSQHIRSQHLTLQYNCFVITKQYIYGCEALWLYKWVISIHHLKAVTSYKSFVFTSGISVRYLTEISINEGWWSHTFCSEFEQNHKHKPAESSPWSQRGSAAPPPRGPPSGWRWPPRVRHSWCSERK